jgi:phytol kinase
MKVFCARAGITFKQQLNSLWKELFRKSIHLCTAFVPLLLHFWKYPVLILLGVALVLYSVSEILRMKGFTVPVISEVTAVAARKRDENRFVLGPVTLVAGIIICAFCWNEQAAAVGIYALAFGDGLASLGGKMIGRICIFGTNGKTVAGSLTCFTAIFCSTWIVTKHTGIALILALAGMMIEVMPLKDFDNLLIPVLLGGIAQFLISRL